MKKFLLLSSTAAMLIWSNYVNAACVSTPSCTTLGYDSKTPCSNGGIKCPFGEAWNCKISELKDKITECEKEIEELEEQNSAIGGCGVGDYLYSDMSCDPYLHTDECPIGIVVDGINNIAISKDTFGSNSNHSASERYFFAPGQNIDLTNSGIPAPKYPRLDFNGKKNTYDLYDYCKKKNLSCPVLEKVANYSIGKTSPGDWYIPAYGEARHVENLSSLIYLKLSSSGCKHGIPFYENPYGIPPVWSSTIFYPNKAFYVLFERYGVYNSGGQDGSIYEEGVDSDVYPLDYESSTTVMLVQFTQKKKEVDSNRDCQIGDILFADKTCSNVIGVDKTPIGVVVDPEKRKAVGLFERMTSLLAKFTNYTCNLPKIASSTEDALKDMNGKQNTDNLYQCAKKNNDMSIFVENAVKYKTEGTKEGDWYIPSLGELNLVFNENVIRAIKLVNGKFASMEIDTGFDDQYFTRFCSSTYKDDEVTYFYGFSYDSVDKIRPTSIFYNEMGMDREGCLYRYFIQYQYCLLSNDFVLELLQ